MNLEMFSQDLEVEAESTSKTYQFLPAARFLLISTFGGPVSVTYNGKATQTLPADSTQVFNTQDGFRFDSIEFTNPASSGIEVEFIAGLPEQRRSMTRDEMYEFERLKKEVAKLEAEDKPFYPTLKTLRPGEHA